MAARYIEGLKDSIHDRLELNFVWSMSQAVNFALKVEIQQARQTKTSFNCRHWQETPSGSSKVTTPAVTKPQPVGNPIMPSSSNNAEFKTPPRPKFQTKENPYAKPSTLKCFRCFQPGHKSNECPQRQQVHIAEGEGGVESEEAEVHEEEEVENILADKGEPLICVMEKLLLAPRQTSNSQHHAIFRTRCTINGKVCDLLIDSGCTENVISRSVVQSLQLKTTKHPNPYKISWVRKGMEINVNDSCRVTFSLGKHYVCEVLCDVLNMDVCHLILGRSWQYDMGATYDGRANAYSFEWKGRRLRLLPGSSDESNRQKAKAEKQEVMHVVTGSTLLHCWREPAPLFALLLTEPNEDTKQTGVQPDVQELLEAYHSIMPSELPAELPPLRSIQRQIDFIPGSTLPNLPHYRLNPKEQGIL
ncbi:hypothetical protein KFK09_027513 [Dendrobium nobile]|uniref:CCHC-type domain-containing protein n=1 Tax=Dendrobium nobile TaxID=94219 RepID=A0A8T3A9Y9_DENNO|nr:hypothetical protein KFK09_027513 [Dendrobium nobile]